MAYGKRQTYQLRTADFDAFGHVKPSAVLDVCQDCAGQNAEDMPGMDFESMKRRGLIWVVTRLAYDVDKQPVLHEVVEVETWPLAPTRKGFQREYAVRGKEGQTLIRGSSEWVVMSFEERKLVSGRDFAAGTNGETEGDLYRDDVALGRRLRKLAVFEARGAGHPVRAEASDMDVNGHVNNARYADWGLDALSPGPDEVISGVQMDFRRELRVGEALRVHVLREKRAATVMGVKCDGGEVSFAMHVEFA